MGEFQKKVKDIQERLQAHGIVMSRVPKTTREEFVKYAEEEFCDDYGMCLKYVWDNFKLWKIFFQNMEYKLDEIIRKLDNPIVEEKPEGINMLSGRKVMKGGKKTK